MRCAGGGIQWALLAFLLAAGSDSAQAVQVITELGGLPAESAVDDLNGLVGVMSAPLHPTSFGGSYNAAAFTDGNLVVTNAPSENVFWYPDGQAYYITWDLGTNTPRASRQLDTVAINIDAHDPGRHGFFGSLSVSADGVTFTEVPGTRYKAPLVQAGTGFAPLFNNITYCFAPGEVTGFRYLRLNSFDDVSLNLLQPRYVEVDGYTSRVPGPSSRPTFWSIRNGRFYVDEQWVFLKTGKLLRYFGGATDASPFISDLDVMIDQLNYNHVSLNIYPDQFDTLGVGRVQPDRQPGVEVIKQIIDHCWQRGIFVLVAGKACQVFRSSEYSVSNVTFAGKSTQAVGLGHWIIPAARAYPQPARKTTRVHLRQPHRQGGRQPSNRPRLGVGRGRQTGFRYFSPQKQEGLHLFAPGHTSPTPIGSTLRSAGQPTAEPRHGRSNQ